MIPFFYLYVISVRFVWRFVFYFANFHLISLIFFGQHAVSDTAILYGHCWKSNTGSAIEQHDPFSFIGSTGHTALDWLSLKSFTQFSHGVLEGFCCWDGMRNKSGAFFCPLFLIPCTSAASVLHLRGRLGRKDGGCIVSWGGFTVRFATSSLSPLNVPLRSKAAKSLLTGKLWTHRELIRVNARLAIYMWIGCGCITGLFMSYTPQCLGLLSFETSHCHRCMLGRNILYYMVYYWHRSIIQPE